ncbi:MAG: hypothetical protein ABI162_20115 [Luteolibacter sp.]
MKTKLASLLLAAVDGFALAHTRLVGDFAENIPAASGTCVLMGLVSIWLAEFFGAFSGSPWRGDCVTPAPFFVFLGWLLLGIPLVIYVWSFIAALNSPIPA